MGAEAPAHGLLPKGTLYDVCCFFFLIPALTFCPGKLINKTQYLGLVGDKHTVPGAKE